MQKEESKKAFDLLKVLEVIGSIIVTIFKWWKYWKVQKGGETSYYRTSKFGKMEKLTSKYGAPLKWEKCVMLPSNSCVALGLGIYKEKKARNHRV